MKQPELIKQQAPAVSEQDVTALINALRGKGWVKAKDLLKWTERELRAIANASKGQIISGQHGYRLTSEASLEEIGHASRWLKNQGKAMIRRALEIDLVSHRRNLPNQTTTNALD